MAAIWSIFTETGRYIRQCNSESHQSVMWCVPRQYSNFKNWVNQTRINLWGLKLAASFGLPIPCRLKRLYLLHILDPPHVCRQIIVIFMQAENRGARSSQPSLEKLPCVYLEIITLAVYFTYFYCIIFYGCRARCGSGADWKCVSYWEIISRLNWVRWCAIGGVGCGLKKRKNSL